MIFMTCILIHGLGQDASSWDNVKTLLGRDVETPDLFQLLKDKTCDYTNLLEAFSTYLNQFEDPLELCGLSLGGLLALDYAKSHPDKVRSLILIGIPHRVPQFLFRLQGILFHLMPVKSFTEIGTDKNSFITLMKSMQNLDILAHTQAIQCETLLLCGEKDKSNRKSLLPLSKVIPNSTTLLVPDAGHTVNTDNPQKLADIILNHFHAYQKV